jgi:hypothetical protein
VPEINCHIPVRVRITGRPSDAQLDQLAETVARAVAARIRFAERTINGETPPATHAPRAPAGNLIRLASTTAAPAAPPAPAEQRPRVRINLRPLRKLKRPSVRINLRGPRTRKPRVVTPRALRVFEEIAGQVDEYAVLRKKLYGLGHLFEVDHLIEKRFISLFSAHGGTEHPDTWPSMAVPKNRQVAAQIPGYTGYIHLEKTRRMEALIPHQLEELYTPQQVWDAHARVLQELGLGDELTRVQGLFEQLDLDPPVEFRRTAPPGTFDNWPRYELVTPPKPAPTPTPAPARPAATPPPTPTPTPSSDAAGPRVEAPAPPPTPAAGMGRPPAVRAPPLAPRDDESRRPKPPAQATTTSRRRAAKSHAPSSVNDRAAVNAVARELASESAATLKGELRLLRTTRLVRFASTAFEAFVIVGDIAEFYSMVTGGLAGRGFILREELAAARQLEAFAERLAGDYEPVNSSLAGMHRDLFKAGMDARAAADAADELWHVYTTLGGVERDLDERVPRVETVLGEVRAKLELATRIVNSPSASTAAMLAEFNTGNLARVVAAREDLYVLRAALDKSLRLFRALRDLLGADRDFLRSWYMALAAARD